MHVNRLGRHRRQGFAAFPGSFVGALSRASQYASQEHTTNFGSSTLRQPMDAASFWKTRALPVGAAVTCGARQPSRMAYLLSPWTAPPPTRQTAEQSSGSSSRRCQAVAGAVVPCRPTCKPGASYPDSSALRPMQGRGRLPRDAGRAAGPMWPSHVVQASHTATLIRQIRRWSNVNELGRLPERWARCQAGVAITQCCIETGTNGILPAG